MHESPEMNSHHNVDDLADNPSGKRSATARVSLGCETSKASARLEAASSRRATASMSQDRRRWLQTMGVGCASGLLASASWPLTALVNASPPSPVLAPTPAANSGDWPVRYCLNTSTIRGQQLGLVAEIELAGKAGYDGIEPWIRQIEQYQQEGGTLRDLRKRLEDHGLRVESAIGFPQWIVDDQVARAQALEQAKREMGMIAELGGSRIAAPPAGATDRSDMDLNVIAERYRALLEVGRGAGVVPQLELWGFSKTLHRLGELLYVASEANHPDACVLPDVYHIFKGGSGFDGLRMLAGTSVHCFHMNDYPAEPPRETINDADRVYPGDGVAPLNQILQTLRANGFAGVLSLELFNPRYYELPAEEVVTTGLAKMKQAVANSLS